MRDKATEVYCVDPERVLSILREHEPELRAAGLTHLRLFGSVARDEANAESDVDVMVDFDSSKPVTLFTVAGIQRRLSETPGTEVDLSSEDWMHEPARKRAIREAVSAFRDDRAHLSDTLAAIEVIETFVLVSC